MALTSAELDQVLTHVRANTSRRYWEYDDHLAKQKAHRGGLLWPDGKALAFEGGGSITGDGAAIDVTGKIKQDGIAIWPTDWTAYDVTDTGIITASGSMTIATPAIVNSRYKVSEKTCTFNCSITFTTGGTASNAIRIILPVTPHHTATNSFGGGCRVFDGGATRGGVFRYNNAGYVDVQLAAGGNWALAASQGIQATFEYEVD